MAAMPLFNPETLWTMYVTRTDQLKSARLAGDIERMKVFNDSVMQASDQDKAALLAHSVVSTITP